MYAFVLERFAKEQQPAKNIDREIVEKCPNDDRIL